MTRLLPYLLLPLGVALLEFHGIQFWTVAVTGGWTGWFTAAFWLAWSAWGWPLLLEGGALWCWLQSRDDGQALGQLRAAGWTFAGGVLTIVLCTAALWNVAEPVRQSAALTAELGDQQARAAARVDGAQKLLRENKPYTRLMDNLVINQKRSDALDQQVVDNIKAGGAVSEGGARVIWWLQIACVVLGQLLVVAAARNVGWHGEAGRRAPAVEAPKPKRGDVNIYDDLVFDGVEWIPNEGPKAQALYAELRAQGAAPGAVASPVSPALRVAPVEETDAAALTETTEPVAESAEETAEPGEPEGTQRVRRALAKIETLWPRETQEVRAAYLGVGERDMSLLKNHEQLTERKKTARHTKVISDNMLRKIEAALATRWVDRQPAPRPPGRVRSL